MQMRTYTDRLLERAIQGQLQNPLAKMLLPGAIVDDETVQVTVADDQLAITGSKLAQAA
jgi:ATP-dependent Clp protease ATP-binding subunit ClpA